MIGWPDANPIWPLIAHIVERNLGKKDRPEKREKIIKARREKAWVLGLGVFCKSQLSLCKHALYFDLGKIHACTVGFCKNHRQPWVKVCVSLSKQQRFCEYRIDR